MLQYPWALAFLGLNEKYLNCLQVQKHRFDEFMNWSLVWKIKMNNKANGYNIGPLWTFIVNHCCLKSYCEIPWCSSSILFRWFNWDILMPIYCGSSVSHERESLLAISWWHHALMFIECDVTRKWEPKKMMLCLPSLILNLKWTALILNSLKSAHSLSQPRLKPYWRTSENSVVLQHFLLTSDQLWLCGVCLHSVRLCKKALLVFFCFFLPLGLLAGPRFLRREIGQSLPSVSFPLMGP